ncbi:MAG: alpha-glucuronidase [Lachnospiraceae bacterium]|jgi:alpha-glucuronidase|nr:alpha-glucuronidase [Lachnospiraceae bacterium]
MMNWGKAWLNYKKIDGMEETKLLDEIYYYWEDPIIVNAAAELETALTKMQEISVTSRRIEKGEEAKLPSGVILQVEESSSLDKEGYRITREENKIFIEGKEPTGVLYGAFHLIRLIGCGESIERLAIEEAPSNPNRMLNHWDNIDGSIERGYAGKSIFFDKENILLNDRTRDYARLCASVGINGVVINNVNVRGAATRLITKEYLPQLKKMADIFHGYGIKLFLSLNFAAPMEIGGLTLADPLDSQVITWWKGAFKEIYEYIPDFGGFLVKADSEGRPGPFTYHRTHAEGANMLAEIIKPYGGIIVWRCFVYNCKQDWRDRLTDRAKAGYDNFMPLDGKFNDNVILQIKNGPMDFQVREPVSPLLGGLRHTNQILEVQVTQEYTGQQRHVCYLIPMWEEVLKFKTYCGEKADTVADIVSGRTFYQTNCGMAGVANIGNDENWTGHDLAAANWYGFGRISWDTTLTAEEIAKEWILMTFSDDERVIENITGILMNSWPAYEKYTSPLGIGWMVNPGHHYGPNVDGYEYDRWGTYHRADCKGIGVERGQAGTGYTLQYHEPNASMYEKIETCPEELLLFFHYISYTHKLKSGKTLIQHIYDTHFEGVEDVEEMIKKWKALEGSIDSDAFERVTLRLKEQLSNSKDWRDIVNSYFYRKSGIADGKNRTIY